MSKPKPIQELVRKSITLPQALWDEVAAYRQAEFLGSDAEAVRRLLLAGLAAKTVRKK